MTDRTLTPGPLAALTEDIRDHGYAIVQTRIERVPGLIRGLKCQEPDGCTNPATLATLAVEKAVEDDGPLGLCLTKAEDSNPLCIVTCDEHRSEASHDLYRDLTGRTRPDGIRAFDVPGQHMNWT